MQTEVCKEEDEWHSKTLVPRRCLVNILHAFSTACRECMNRRKQPISFHWVDISAMQTQIPLVECNKVHLRKCCTEVQIWILVLYSIISFLCYFLRILHFISEGNILLITLLQFSHRLVTFQRKFFLNLFSLRGKPSTSKCVDFECLW